MYVRKQSLIQRPILLISHSGQPIAAAVDAAPMRKECDEMEIVFCDKHFKRLLISVLVKGEPFLKMKNGPAILVLCLMYVFKALTGHN